MGTTRRTTLGLTALVALLAVALGTQVAVAGGDSSPQAVGDEELLERLAGVEADLPGILPVAVEVSAEDGEGSLEGDFGGGATTIGTVAGDLTSLFRDADDATTEVGEAVASVARGWLDLGQAYEGLSRWEGNDLAFPLDTFDDDGVATGADEARGSLERGLRHVLVAHERLLTGYVALRTAGEAAEADAQARFDARAAEAEEWKQEVRPVVGALLGLAGERVVVPAQRFQTDAPGVEARARTVEITCVDREAVAAFQEKGELSAASLQELLDDTGCTELPAGVSGDDVDD